MRLYRPKWVLIDIEGTTTKISFVKEVLFPYARQRMRQFIIDEQGSEQVRLACQSTARDAGISEGVSDYFDQVATKLELWIDEDKKHSALKELQGILWRSGYENGDYLAHVYADVAPSLEAWKKLGIKIAIYSSGSVLAQKLLFGHSVEGDLNPYFSKYFDTQVGPKKESSSYQKICTSLEADGSDVIFLSDVTGELDAAASSGMTAIHILRPGTDNVGYAPSVASFSELNFD